MLGCSFLTASLLFLRSFTTICLHNIFVFCTIICSILNFQFYIWNFSFLFSNWNFLFLRIFYFGLTPLSGDRRGYMPPLLRTECSMFQIGTLCFWNPVISCYNKVDKSKLVFKYPVNSCHLNKGYNFSKIFPAACMPSKVIFNP